MVTKNDVLIVIKKKGRVIISKEFRKDFLGKVMIARDRRGCLVLLTEQEWNKLVEGKILGLKGSELRRAKRVFCSSTFEVELDNQGGILVPINLRRHVLALNPGEKAIVIKANNHLEIWSEENWQKRKEG